MNSPDWIIELKNYPTGVLEELRKVTWPNKQRVRDLTLIVFAVVIVSSMFVAGIDWLFRRGITLLIS